MSSEPGAVGYVLKRFPRLSETFILNEVLELERQGQRVEIFSLMRPEGGIQHRQLAEVRARVTYLPEKIALRDLAVREAEHAERLFQERLLGEVIDAGTGLGPLPRWMQAAAIAMLARSRGIRHLHAHFASDAATVAMLAGRMTRIPFSFTAHAKDIFDESVDLELLKEKIREARFVVTVSEYNRRYLTSLMRDARDAEKIVRLYNGIDLEQFHPEASVPREPDLVLAVGRLVEKKGFIHLVRAWGRLRDRGCAYRCVLVGDGPERKSLAREIEALGLEEQFHLAGAMPQEQLLQLLRRAALFVLPCVVSASGDRDALPTVLLEALAVGLPAISSELVGIPEIVDHGVSGLLVPPGDATALAEAIEQVMADAELRERLGRAGPIKAQAAFDLCRNVRALRRLLAGSMMAEARLRRAVDEAVIEPALTEDANATLVV
jgi:colanic acid/amylovoran biosynthesis glycosyltransferase